MGESLDGVGHPISSTARYMANMALVWLKLATRGYHRIVLRKLLGKLQWCSRPRRVAGCFLAGACTWLHKGPPMSKSTPPALLKFLAEMFVATTVLWRAPCAREQPRMQFVDATAGLGRNGQHHGVPMILRGRFDSQCWSVLSKRRN